MQFRRWFDPCLHILLFCFWKHIMLMITIWPACLRLLRPPQRQLQIRSSLMVRICKCLFARRLIVFDAGDLAGLDRKAFEGLNGIVFGAAHQEVVHVALRNDLLHISSWWHLRAANRVFVSPRFIQAFLLILLIIFWSVILGVSRRILRFSHQIVSLRRNILLIIGRHISGTAFILLIDLG